MDHVRRSNVWLSSKPENAQILQNSGVSSVHQTLNSFVYCQQILIVAFSIYDSEQVCKWALFLLSSDRVEGDRSEGSGQENEDEQ